TFAEDGGTVLVSSHLLAEMGQTVDDVVIIARGRLVLQSSLADLTRRSRAGVRVRTPQPAALRSALAAAGVAAELVAGDTGVALAITSGTKPLDSGGGVRYAMSAGASGAVMLLVIGILMMAGEFRHGTATSTFLITPDRLRVVVAKLVAASIVGACIATVAS